MWLNGTAEGELTADRKFSLLRPETIESLWYLYRLTGERRYKEWGWKIFEATEQHCKTEAGYTGIKDVTVVPPEHDDQMQSFFLAETLKVCVSRARAPCDRPHSTCGCYSARETRLILESGCSIRRPTRCGYVARQQQQRLRGGDSLANWVEWCPAPRSRR